VQDSDRKYAKSTQKIDVETDLPRKGYGEKPMGKSELRSETRQTAIKLRTGRREVRVLPKNKNVVSSETMAGPLEQK